MKIYKLSRDAAGYYDIYDNGLDEYVDKVIVAENCKHARQVANQEVGAEGKIWEDENEVSCKEVNLDEAGVVLNSIVTG